MPRRDARESAQHLLLVVREGKCRRVQHAVEIAECAAADADGVFCSDDLFLAHAASALPHVSSRSIWRSRRLSTLCTPTESRVTPLAHSISSNTGWSSTKNMD